MVIFTHFVGAATSLKYATPQDLPWYPSVGIADPDSSAGAAASLANSNQKSFEYWKPEYSDPANKSAHLAWDYKADPLWHPEPTVTGSKAATLAAKHGGDVKIWRPEATSEANSAAGQSMRMKNLSPAVDYGYTADGHKKALMAATGAMSGRKRAGSTPLAMELYPDQANASGNALNAASVASRPSTKARSRNAPTDLPGLSEADATRIHDAAITKLGREMYTSHPPVAPEVEEKNHQAGIRAAAVSMAKQMYAVQQKALEQQAGVKRSDSNYAANSAHHRRKSSMSSDTTESVQAYPPQYANLQETAQKLAAERLAKLYDANAVNADYRAYYGANNPVQSRLSMRGRMRRRASSDGQLPETDAERSQQIRSQMSVFNNKLAEVDAKKRQKDRDALMAAAQRNVTQRMHGMDEKVFADTGKVSPAMASEWEAKARARAEADSTARMVNHGKINIGGGRYMDQSEVDAIAQARVQPTLDEISAKAEAQRARDEQVRKETEDRKRLFEEQQRSEKERNAKSKDEWKRFKGTYGSRRPHGEFTDILAEEEKREERAKKGQALAKKAEEKRLRSEEKRKSKAGPVGAAVVTAEKSKDLPAADAPVLGPIAPVAPLDSEEIAHAGSEELVPVKTEDSAMTAVTAEENAPIDAETAEEDAPITAEEAAPVFLEGYASPTEEETAEKKIGGLASSAGDPYGLKSAGPHADPVTGAAETLSQYELHQDRDAVAAVVDPEDEKVIGGPASSAGDPYGLKAAGPHADPITGGTETLSQHEHNQESDTAEAMVDPEHEKVIGGPASSAGDPYGLKAAGPHADSITGTTETLSQYEHHHGAEAAAPPMETSGPSTIGLADTAREETEAPAADEVKVMAAETVPVAQQKVVGENVTDSRAESIAARVFGAPITDASEDIQIPAIAADDAVAVDPAYQTQEAAAEKPIASTATPVSEAPLAGRVAPAVIPAIASTASGPSSTPKSPKADQPKLSSWLKSKFGRGSKSSAASDEATTPASASSSKRLSKAKGTVEPTTSTAAGGNPAVHPASSVRDVAMAGKQDPTNTTAATAPSTSHADRSRSTSISSLSSDVPTSSAHHGREPDSFETPRGRTRGNEFGKEVSSTGEHLPAAAAAAAEPPTPAEGEGSTPEEFEEARDHFDAGKLPLPSFKSAEGRVGESPVRDSRFVENL